MSFISFVQHLPPPPERKWHFLDPIKNFYPPTPDIPKKPFPLHSFKATYPQILYWVHFTFNVHVHFNWLYNHWLGIHFRSEIIHKACNWLGNQKYKKPFISIDSIDVISFCDSHWKSFWHSKMKLKLMIYLWYVSAQSRHPWIRPSPDGYL